MINMNDMNMNCLLKSLNQPSGSLRHFMFEYFRKFGEVFEYFGKLRNLICVDVNHQQRMNNEWERRVHRMFVSSHLIPGVLLADKGPCVTLRGDNLNINGLSLGLGNLKLCRAMNKKWRGLNWCKMHYNGALLRSRGLRFCWLKGLCMSRLSTKNFNSRATGTCAILC